ncbi:MAG: hypothetical protein LIO71_00875 [Ruminococcus sp.]|nr:hypothetical protein [Ruminococcus sp.]MCD7800644.1 hypothetical protein [Ruminococcus sp.]
MFKKILLTMFFSILTLGLVVGFIEVYTNSYNAMNRNHIVDFYFEYSPNDKTLYATIGGKNFEISI